MIQKYPVGIQSFREARIGNYVYVDKTMYIETMLNQGKYYFLSRPRRFGKSMFISTLEAFFKGEKELFKDLYIDNRWDWQQTYPVIKISFSNIGHNSIGLRNAIDGVLETTAKNYNISLTLTGIDSKFRELIEKLSSTYGQFVVLIDENDKPIIDFLGKDIVKAIENRDIMKVFYSILKDADPYLKLVFITGVSKFARVSIFSDLNNITDITTDKFFPAICGISQDELEQYFVKELEIYSKEKIKKWYNGYTWDLKTSVYNPFSLLHFFRSGEFRNIWFESGTPTFLINLSRDAKMYDFENIEISANQLSSYDIEKLQIIPLMFQTGYLTLKSYDEEAGLYTLNYPNEEVRQSYLEVLVDSYTQNEVDLGRPLAVNLRNTLRVNNLEKLQYIFNSLFKGLPYTLWQKDSEYLYHAIIHLTFRLLGIFVESEVQTSDGRMDALVKIDNYIYCFEFKLDGSAEQALTQIKDKGYLTPYLNQGKKCIAIGINFSSETKKIERVLWEEID